MRIGFATPFNKNSAIAVFSRSIALELTARGHGVEILRTEVGADAISEPLDAQLAIAPIATGVAVRNRYDLCIVNTGDNYLFHGRCLDVLASAPCLMIAHDAHPQNFLNGLRAGSPQVRDFIDNNFGSETIADAPIALLARLALSAIVHGPHYLETVRGNCPGPVISLPLSYPRTLPTHPLPTPDDGDGFVVVVFGIINRNKQVDRVLKAIAGSPSLSGRAEIRIVGAVEEAVRTEIDKMASGLALRALRYWDGWVSEENLWQHLKEADAICCLRYPVIEGGSASLITALYSGRPLVIADHASYSQVPHDLVEFVSYGDNSEDLRNALERLDSDREAAQTRAQRAAIWADEVYSAQSYVDRLESLLEQTLARAPLWDAAHAIGQTLADMGLRHDAPSVSHLGGVFSEMFVTTDASK